MDDVDVSATVQSQKKFTLCPAAHKSSKSGPSVSMIGRLKDLLKDRQLNWYGIPACVPLVPSRLISKKESVCSFWPNRKK